MIPELALILGGVGAALLGLKGIALQRAATPIRELLSEDEKRTYDTQVLLTTGEHLCPSCQLRFTKTDFCGVCEQLRTLQARAVQIESREPKQIAKNEVRRGTRSHVGYRPLYMHEGFADLFQEGGSGEAKR